MFAFAWVQRKEISRRFAARNDAGFLLLIVALAVHVWAMLWRAYYLSALMISLALFGLLALKTTADGSE
jgi:hypothetical protein